MVIKSLALKSRWLKSLTPKPPKVAADLWASAASMAIVNGIPNLPKTTKTNYGNGNGVDAPHRNGNSNGNVANPNHSVDHANATKTNAINNGSNQSKSQLLPPLPPNVIAIDRSKSSRASANQPKSALPTPMELQADRGSRSISRSIQKAVHRSSQNRVNSDKFNAALASLSQAEIADLSVTPRSPTTNQPLTDSADHAQPQEQTLRILSDAEKRAQQEANVYMDGLFDDYEVVLGDRNHHLDPQSESRAYATNSKVTNPGQAGLSGIEKFRQRQRNQFNDQVNNAEHVAPALPETAFAANPGTGRYQFWVALGATVIAVAAAGYSYNQARVAQQDLENVEVAADYRSAGEYEACINQAQIGAANQVIAGALQNVLQSCQTAQTDRQAQDQLVLAQSLADSGKLKEAITIAARVSPDAQSYAESQQLINTSSQRLLNLAQAFYHKGQLDAASSMVAVIPETSNIKGKALSSLALWQQEQQQNESTLLKAKQHLSQGDWQAAIAAARQVSPAPHWQKQAQAIITEAQSKQIAANPTLPSDRRANNPPPASNNPGNNIYNSPATSYYEPAPRYNPPAPRVQEPRYYNPPPSYSPPVYEPPYVAPAPSYDPSPPSRAD
jgi:hypothetical protein